LGSPAFYIGALGSKKTHGARLGRLTQAGFGETDLARSKVGRARYRRQVAGGDRRSVLAQLTAARRNRQSKRS